MKHVKEITEELARVESDERLGYPTANVVVNAPLALIQTVLETRRDTLRWALDGNAVTIKRSDGKLITDILAYLIDTLNCGVDEEYKEDWIKKAENQIRLLEEQIEEEGKGGS